jgi:hypothetical protein
VDMHEGQLAISSGMVRELVDAQFPRWRRLAVTRAGAAGTVNAVFPDRRPACGPVPAEAG